MERTTVTYEDVAAAADALLAAGEKVTLRSVRTQLGTGSFGTIQRHLPRWREQQRPPLAPDAGGLPNAIQQSILDEIAHQIAAAQAALTEQLTESQAEGADLAQDNERLDDQVTTLLAQIADLNTALAGAKARADKAEEDAAKARAAADQDRENAEKARIEAAQARLQADTLKESTATFTAENQGLRTDLETLRKQIADADKRAAVAEARVDDLQRQAGALEARITDLTNERQGLLDDRETNRARAATLQADLQGMQAEKTACDRQLERVTAQLDTAVARERDTLAELHQALRQPPAPPAPAADE